VLAVGGEVATLAAEVVPYASAAAAYGGAVLAKVRDDAADATVGLGRRLLQRIFGTRNVDEPLPGPVADVVADPADEDALAALRLAVRKALAADSGLQDQVRDMLARAGVSISGDVTNTISGGTQHGPVLQGRDFSNLSFGAAPAPPAAGPEDPDAG
jgi:ABC-type glycerol-3-phosphate transport system substrate-binding protein